MIKNEFAELLLKQPKFVIENESKLQDLIISQPPIWRTRYFLISEFNEELYEFIWEIWQSTKNMLKLSLHFQDDESKIGLFRIDYYSGHTNPQYLSDKVPIKFHPYVGKHFTLNEHHVHYHVEGYPSLAWALPIEKDNFPLKISQIIILQILLSHLPKLSTFKPD